MSRTENYKAVYKNPFNNAEPRESALLLSAMNIVFLSFLIFSFSLHYSQGLKPLPRPQSPSESRGVDSAGSRRESVLTRGGAPCAPHCVTEYMQDRGPGGEAHPLQ